MENFSLEFLFTPDDNLNLERLSWITEPQKNRLIMELFSNLKEEEAKNSILERELNK